MWFEQIAISKSLPHMQFKWQLTHNHCRICTSVILCTRRVKINIKFCFLLTKKMPGPKMYSENEFITATNPCIRVSHALTTTLNHIWMWRHVKQIPMQATFEFHPTSSCSEIHSRNRAQSPSLMILTYNETKLPSSEFRHSTPALRKRIIF